MAESSTIKTVELTNDSGYHTNQILHSEKDHYIFFVGGPNKTHWRWRKAAIIKKSKIGHISAAVQANDIKFVTLKHTGPPDKSNS